MANLNQTVAPLSTIIGWFAEDAQPTNVQFETTWKSFFHKSENIPVEQIYQLTDILNQKAEREHLHLDLAKRDGSNLDVDDINGLKEVLGVALAANGIINNIETTITSEDANVLQDGIYKPKTTGVYASIGLTAKENYTTLFKKLDGIWSIFSEEKLPVQDLSFVEQQLATIENKTANNELELSQINNFLFILNVIGDIIKGNYVNNTGALISGANWQCSNLIAIEHNKEYTYEGRTSLDNGTSSAAQSIVAFNANGTFNSVILSTYNSVINGKYIFKIINTDIAYIRVSSRIGFDFQIYKHVTQLPSERVENLSDLKKEFDTLLSGVIDLTGNLTAAYINSVGVAVNIGTWFCTDFIPVENEKEYLYEGKTNLGSGTAYAIVGYNSAKEKVTSILYTYDSTTSGIFKFKITDPSIVYIRACSHNSVNLKLYEVSDTIPKDRIEGLVTLEKTVKELSENTGIGPIVSDKSWASIGDSITAFDQTNKGYQSYIKEKIAFTSYSNQGYSGRSLTMAGDRASILEGIANIGAFDIYTIAAGTNDFRLDRPIGTTNDYVNNTGATTFYGALRGTIDLLYSKRQSSKIYIFSPLRRNNAGYTSFSTNNAGHKLIDYRDALEWVAKHEALTFLDLFNDSGITDRNLSLYTSDGLHPTTIGHKLISQRMISEIKIRI